MNLISRIFEDLNELTIFASGKFNIPKNGYLRYTEKDNAKTYEKVIYIGDIIDNMIVSKEGYKTGMGRITYRFRQTPYSLTEA